MNFFPKIDIKNITCIFVKGQLKENDKINFQNSQVDIYIEMDDREMPFALGSRGHFIHLVNAFLKSFIGDLTFFLRS